MNESDCCNVEIESPVAVEVQVNNKNNHFDQSRTNLNKQQQTHNQSHAKPNNNDKKRYCYFCAAILFIIFISIVCLVSGLWNAYKHTGWFSSYSMEQYGLMKR